jgi:hypothetical protein
VSQDEKALFTEALLALEEDTALLLKYRKMSLKGIMELCERQREEIKVKRDALFKMEAALKRGREAVNAIVLSTNSVSFRADLKAIDDALALSSEQRRDAE